MRKSTALLLALLIFLSVWQAAKAVYLIPSGGGNPGGSTGQLQYNNSGSFGGLTDTQVTTHVNAFTSSLSGAAPSSGGGSTNFLRADGTWAAPAGSGGSPGGSNGQIQYNNSSSFGGLTDPQLTTHINAFTTSLSGAAPSSGGGTTNFLRADGSWAAPSGSGASTYNTLDTTRYETYSQPVGYGSSGIVSVADSNRVSQHGSGGQTILSSDELGCADGGPNILCNQIQPGGSNGDSVTYDYSATFTKPSFGPRLSGCIAISTNLTHSRTQFGWFNTSPSNVDNPTSQCAIVYYSNGLGNWHFWTYDGSAGTDTDLGVAPTAFVMDKFVINFTSGTSCDVWVNGVKKATATTHLPTAALRWVANCYRTATGTATGMYIGTVRADSN